jgi:hypothetical protein
MQTKLNLTHSVFDENIDINETQHAVSFCKLSAKSMINSKVTSHHAFILLQEPNALYRKEIGVEADEVTCRVVQNTRFIFKDAQVEGQLKSILWGDENAQWTIDQVGQKTWAISSEKAAELIASINLDIANPPKYAVVGNTSLLKTAELKDRDERGRFLSYLGLGFGALATGIMGAPIVPGSAIVAPAMGMGVFTGTILTGSVLGGMAGFCMPTDQDKFKAHNCATWCVEKLTNLKIPEINQDLGITYTDMFAYVTGLHIPANEEDKKVTIEILKSNVINTIIDKNSKIPSEGMHVDAIKSTIGQIVKF